MATAADIALLRLFIADPPGENAVLNDTKLEGILTDNEDDIYAAAADCWRIKAGNIADWYQVNLDGAFLSRQQVWEHCLEMAKHYESAGGGTLVNVQLDSGFDIDEEEAEFS